MTVKAGYLTPLLHVADVERSLRLLDGASPSRSSG